MGRLLDLARRFDAGTQPPPMTAVMAPTGPSPVDPLTRLLDVPLRSMTKPLEVVTSILGETVWLVANDRQAATIEAEGGTAYTPEEVGILRDPAASVTPEGVGRKAQGDSPGEEGFSGKA